MLDRTLAPAFETISDPVFPHAEKVLLKTGTELIWLPKNEQPVIMMDLVIPIGRFQEKAPGLTYLVSKMLLEGTEKKTSADIANQLDFYGSHLDIRPTLDHVFIKLFCLKRFFENQCDLLFELLSQASFPEKEYEKVKSIRVHNIRQQHSKSNAFCGLKFREAIFGASHPYGQIIDHEQVKQVSLDEVKSFYKDEFLVEPTLFLAGDVGEQEIQIIQTKLSALDFVAGQEKRVHGTQTTPHVRVERDQSVQSTIRMGASTIGQDHEDIHRFKIASDFLGGYFGSRLMKNIREEKGLTYGIGANVMHLQEGDYWVIGTDVLKEKVGLATDEIRKEIKQLQQETPKNEELQAFKSYIKGKWLMSFDSCFNSMNMIMHNHMAALSNQYWRDFLDELNTCKPEDISASASRHFKLDEIIEVTVG